MMPLYGEKNKKDTWKRWTIYTSLYLLEYCFYSWRDLMYPHIHGFTDEERMRELFFHYLNYGSTNTYYDY